MHIFYTPDIETELELPEEEAKHCTKVLRLTSGDEILLTDGKGAFFRAAIDIIAGKRCTVNILEKTVWEKPWGNYIHIAVAPTKNMDRIEWFAEKATEIGIDEFSFINCSHSERRVIKTDRVERIVVSAVKQSQKAIVPVINEMTDFGKFISRPFSGRKFIAHCYEGERKLLRDMVRAGEDVLVLIGPEGDFSEDEVKAALDAGFEQISLGGSRLRTETAALVACNTVNILNMLKA